jgi:hypothetical protein
VQAPEMLVRYRRRIQRHLAPWRRPNPTDAIHRGRAGSRDSHEAEVPGLPRTVAFSVRPHRDSRQPR